VLQKASHCAEMMLDRGDELLGNADVCIAGRDRGEDNRRGCLRVLMCVTETNCV
jgi:hypothetical protein